MTSSTAGERLIPRPSSFAYARGGTEEGDQRPAELAVDQVVLAEGPSWNRSW